MFSLVVMSAQLKSSLYMFLRCYPPLTVNLTWCYHERHHGKSPIDGIGGTLKNSVYRMQGECVIDTPKQFAEYAERSVKGITSLYLPTEEFLKEQEDIESSPRITDTLQIHIVKRLFVQGRMAPVPNM